jgi:hypothetical protein
VQSEARCSIKSYSVFVFDFSQLYCSEELIAAAEEKIMLFVGVNVFHMRRENRHELIAESGGRIPLLEGISHSLLQASKSKET